MGREELIESFTNGAKNRNVQWTRRCIALGLDVNWCFKYGATEYKPLEFAITQRADAVAADLLLAGAHVGKAGLGYWLDLAIKYHMGKTFGAFLQTKKLTHNEGWMKTYGFSWLSTAVDSGNRVVASLLIDATLSRPTRANIEVDRAIRQRRFLDAHRLMAEGSTVSMREMALAQTDSNLRMHSLFSEQNEYVKSLCHTLAQTMSSDLLKEERPCGSCLHSISAFLSYEKQTLANLVWIQPLQDSIRISDCGLCAAVLECILANDTIDEEVAYETFISGNDEEVVIDIEQSSKVLNSIIITPGGSPFAAENDLNHTGSNLSMVSILTKLVDCLACHPHCMQAESEFPELPTRIIDVGPQNSSQDPVLRITDGHRGQYVTLSHRWAGSITRTLQANFQSMCHSIPWDELTKTMQDAVTVTRILGIRYLWIDSLCIIQDSREDWSQESLKMSGVYRNSVVTIAADCAHDHSEGFFTSSLRRRKILRISTESLSWRCSADYTMTPEEHASALDQRGWILQEQLLSPRILKFCHGKIEWECSTSGSSPFKRALNGIKSTGVNTRSQAYTSWHQIAQSYSARILTYKSDKLTALMGIADYTRTILGDAFLAGLWKGNLWHDLLWSPTDRHGRLNFKLPTWSWVSIDGPVEYTWPKNGIAARATCLIETVSCEIRNGQSGIHGSLVLRARMQRVYVNYSGLLDVDREYPASDMEYQREKGGLVRWSPDIPMKAVSDLIKPLWLIEIARDDHHHCLCVASVESSPWGYKKFERVGLCRIDVSRFKGHSHVYIFDQQPTTIMLV